MGRIQYWRDTVHERRDSGLKKFRTRGIQEMRDTGIRSGTRFYAFYVCHIKKLGKYSNK